MIDPQTIRSDLCKINACTLEELTEYERTAKDTRGLDPHEVTAIAERRRKLMRGGR